MLLGLEASCLHTGYHTKYEKHNWKLPVVKSQIRELASYQNADDERHAHRCQRLFNRPCVIELFIGLIAHSEETEEDRNIAAEA